MNEGSAKGVTQKQGVKETPPPPALPPPFLHQKIFKKCKSATFQLDGATYTIGILIIQINIMENNSSMIYLSN